MAGSLAVDIRDGTFPDSADLLGQEIDADGISSLLRSLIDSKEELKKEIRDVSQTGKQDVDEWISQAKRVQEDIARCKIEARNIVEEHQRGERLRNTLRDAETQVQLLEAEVAFTKALKDEIQTVSEITQVLREAENDLSKGNPTQAVSKVVSLHTTIATISAARTRSLMSQLDTELRQSCRRKLEHALSRTWSYEKTKERDTLVAHSDGSVQSAAQKMATSASIEGLINAFYELEASTAATAVISSSVNPFIESLLSPSNLYPSSAEIQDDTLVVIRTQPARNTHAVLSVFRTVFEFLHTRLPHRVRNEVAHKLLPTLISKLISQWLDLALPHDLHDLPKLEPLREDVKQLVLQLQNFAWSGDDALNEWIEQVPRSWLAKRRVGSLDAIRKAFASAQGTLRPVERVERQSVAVPEVQSQTQSDDDWNTSWEKDGTKVDSADKSELDDEASGWDFDTEDESSSPDAHRKSTENLHDEDDTGDAWGWGDEEDEKDKSIHQESSAKQHNRTVNGYGLARSKTQEMVLTEIYHVTDIPDHILEIIGKDTADSHELQKSATQYFNTSSPATGLAGLPNLVLALFRATAPTYYSLPSAAYTLSNINLYNDTLYIIQKLTESPDVSNFDSSILSLTKFARQVYSSELDIQRTVLNDLLDGAQGFEGSTTFPRSQACVDAISSTVDRVRELHKEWSIILGESHLLQSLGSLMTMIFGKIIKDIEDMDDISEAESKQLVTFCQQILSLEDLFSSRLPNLSHGQHNTQQQPATGNSQILLYVPNYLRFQYLQQILDSSLVDIKYLWTEGELSLEFSAEEVVDLIKALFAESQHRRNAIRTIRGSNVA